MNLNNITTALKTGIIARYYGWEPKEEDLERRRPRGNHFPYIIFDINVDDAIYEVLTMPREEITI